MFSTILVALAVCLSTIILNIHYRMPSTHKMPAWVRRIFIQKLPRLLLMRVPLQVIKDSMNTRRSKFLRQSDPALKSLAGDAFPQTTRTFTIYWISSKLWLSVVQLGKLEKKHDHRFNFVIGICQPCIWWNQCCVCVCKIIVWSYMFRLKKLIAKMNLGLMFFVTNYP